MLIPYNPFLNQSILIFSFSAQARAGENKTITPQVPSPPPFDKFLGAGGCVEDGRRARPTLTTIDLENYKIHLS